MADLNIQNRTIYHSDNLPVLRGINSGTIDLIATDPPFNKNRDFHATPDSLARGARFEDRWRWEEDVHEEWVDAIKDDWPAVWSVIETARIGYGSDMAAFLCWLGVRLMECHRILKDTGSIYLHIDHTAHAYTKGLMDAIFGRKNFRNEIVWCYTGPSNSKRWFPRKHDTILFYVKSDKAEFNSDMIRVPYHGETLARRGRVEGERSIISASVENKGRRSTTQVEVGFGKGKVVEDWWADIPVLTNQLEKTGYPTQKPLALYERIIDASSNPGGFVLDPFAGCATTPVAAERLGRQWVGIDNWEGAYDLVVQRLNDSRQLATDIPPAVTKLTEPPERTDDDEVPVPDLKIKKQRPRERWERLTHAQMTDILVEAQSDMNGVICAGCGRHLEREFMELDHITPKSTPGARNTIDNRIMLCRPCNGKKGNTLTLPGLVRDNVRSGWMRDRALATLAQQKAAAAAEQVKANNAE